MKLKANQKKYLKSLCQKITYTINIGKNGLTEEVLIHIKNSIEIHELIKIKVLDTVDDDLKHLAEEAAQSCNATIIRIIGKTFILYREAKNTENRKIKLPKPKNDAV